MTLIKRNVYPIILLALVLFIYISFAGRLKSQFPSGPYNYFSHQAYSFLHGKLSLFSTELTHDLSIHNLKKYMYWGPTPVILIAPFVIFFGLNFSDALYTAIISSFAPLVLFFIFRELEKLGIFKIKDALKFLLCLFFSFGTSFFILAVYGQVWFTSQAINTLYLLLALLFLFKFRNTRTKWHLIFSSIFLGLAVWGRSSFALYLPFFLFQLFLTFKNKKNLVKIIFKSILVFAIPLVAILLIYWAYNYLRFGNIMETGYSYHHFHPHFALDKEKYGVLNIFYIPRNFYYMFINFPGYIHNFPYFNFDQEGNSVLFTSPLFMLLLLGLKKYVTGFKKNLTQISMIVTAAVIIFSLLIFFGTGWVQFGYRYLMDAIPLLVILLADVIKKVPLYVVLGLISISVIVNILGILWFFTL